MAGENRTNQFMLATATVMVGPQADLYNLNPETHSLGLVKNVTMTGDPEYIELTQGVKNNLVDSQMVQNRVSCSMEVYEYTSKNLAYGLGLDGASLTPSKVYKLSAPVEALDTTAEFADVDDDSADFTAGKWIYLQRRNGDQVHIARLSSAAVHATGTTTVTFTDQPIPTGVEFGINDNIAIANTVSIGSKEDQPFFAAKIVGVMPNGNRPITILMPKVRITRGFSLAFTSENYGNLPFEITPYELGTSEDFYEDFDGVAKLFVGS